MALRTIAARGGVVQLQMAVPRAAGTLAVCQTSAVRELRDATTRLGLLSNVANCPSMGGCTRLLSTEAQNLVGADPAPSPKALQFAHDLAEQYSVTLPEEAKSSAVLCSAFIDQTLDANPSPPTEKQVAFVTKLCAEKGQQVPAEALVDRRKCSKAIDELLGNAPEGDDSAAGRTEPSDKQILYAARLAREKGMGLSADAIASKTAMSALIDELSAAPQGFAGGAPAVGGVESMGWQPSSPTPVAPYPPPLEQRDQENKGRYPY